MEVTVSSASLEDPRQSPLEVPEESIHGEQPLGNPRTDIGMILLRLQAGQDSLLSEMAQLRTSVNQTNEQLKNSVTLAPPSDPMGLSTASSPSFSSPQMTLDAAQTAASPASPSVYSGDAPIEPGPLSSSEQFRATSSTRMYYEIEEKAHRMLPDDWLKESEAAHIKAEESDQQEDTSSEALSLNTPECETEPQTLTSTEKNFLPVINKVWSLNSESETAFTWAEESHQQENTSSRTSPLFAPECETEPQPLTSTEEAALPMMAAVGSQKTIAESETAHTEPEESDQQENNFSGGSAQAYMPEPQPLTSSLPETPQDTAPAALPEEAPGRVTQLSRRCFTNKRSSSTALTSTTTSPGTLSCLLSSAPADVGPPTKRRRQTSIAWLYFTQQSKFTATCGLCEEDVKAGKTAIGIVGTGALLRHLEHEHEIPSIVWQNFKKQSKFIATCRLCEEIVTTGKIGCDNVGTATLLSHLKHKHGITREKVAPSVLPGAYSKIEDVERPSTIESSNGTTSAASTSTTTSPVMLSCLPSSPPADVGPPTKCRQQTSIAWMYFTKQSKNIATCRICEEDVQAGKIGACGNVGTGALLRHLEHKHEIPSIVWKHFKKWSKSITTCRLCKAIVNIGKIGCGNVGTAPLLSHLKCEHGITQEKVATSVVPGSESEIQDVGRPSAIRMPSRTTSAASIHTTTSAEMLSCLPSAPPADVGPPTKHRRQTSIAWLYFKKWSKFIATCGLCKEIVKIAKIDCRNVGTAALLSHLKRKHGITREKVAPSLLRGARSVIQDAKRPSTIESCSRTTAAASTCTTTSPVTLSCFPSSPPADVEPSTKRRSQTSIAWMYFTQRSRFTATCRLCKKDVKSGKTAFGVVGTGPLLRHLEHEHEIPSIVWQNFKKQSKFIATCRLCKEIVNIGKIGCGNVGITVLLSHLKCKHGMPQDKVATAMVTGAGSEIQDAERPSPTEGTSRTPSAASASTTTSPVMLSCLPASSPADVRPPTKRCQQTSIAWIYFTKQSKNVATCKVCEEDVQAGKIGACGTVGTGALLKHLERKHKVPSITWKHFKKWSKCIATCRLCKEIVNIGKIGCGNVGTAALLSHLKHKHRTTQEKVTPSVVPGAGSGIQDAGRPSTTEDPTSAASASTTPSPVTLSCLPSSSPTEVRPPSKRCRQTSIAWLYFTGRSKFVATCRVCEEDVQIGKVGGCSVLGTAPLLSHLKCKHGIPSIAWQNFTKQSEFTATCSICEEDVKIERTGGCGNVDTEALPKHLNSSVAVLPILEQSMLISDKIPLKKLLPDEIPAVTRVTSPDD
ncbi:UNVERIFIED_CONTAM: hypothetical protein K2H54_061092 [Gekko kuhli]